MQINKSFLTTFVVVGWGLLLHAQDLGTEVINVVRPYTPSVSDAEKVIQNPHLGDTISVSKKKVSYGIQSVPVASTFVPDKGKATTVERKRPEKIFNNYATLGIGNYTSILAEFYSNFEISKTQNFDLFLKHNSAQGGVKDVLLDDKFYNTSLDAAYHVKERDMDYEVGGGILHQVYNWYGLPEFFTSNEFFIENIETIDPQHTYFGAEAHARINMYESVFTGGNLSLGYFGDSYESSELRAVVQPQFAFDLSGVDVGVDVDVDYLSGKNQFYTITENYVENKYSFVKLGGTPYVRLFGDNFEVKLGAKILLGIDSENSNSDVYIYPSVAASYNLSGDSVIVYGGVEGDLDQNTYRDFTQENPFIAPSINVMPTDRTLDVFGGLRGKLSESVSYDLRVSYTHENNKPYYRHFMNLMGGQKGYNYGNSFIVMYDNMNTIGFHGELKAAVTADFDLGVSLDFNSFDVEFADEMYNHPDIKVSVFGSGNFTDKIYGGANLFYVGERKDVWWPISDYSIEPVEETLEGYIDINLHVGYHINNQWSVFVKGNNLLGNSYEKWLYTPVMGLQVMGGATYKFDW